MGNYGYDGSLNASTYDTQLSKKLTLADRIRFNNRLYFTLKYAGIVLKTRKQALAGQFDDKAWIDSSYYILKFIEKERVRLEEEFESQVDRHVPVSFLRAVVKESFFNPDLKSDSEIYCRLFH